MSLSKLFDSFLKDDDEELRAITEKGFQAFTIGLYMETTHARNLIEKEY